MNKEQENRKFVILDTFDNYFTAEVVKSRLIEEGINAYVINPLVNYSFGPTLTQRYRLQVEQSQFLKALNIYKNTLEDS